MRLFGEQRFGFGCMRLPMKGGEVDTEEMCKMVDAFLDGGFCYFDTAHGYHDGKSEPALKACLTSRHPRERYLLADKLSHSYFESEADVRPFFESQLHACGVDCFDFYLMHAQSANNYEHYRACKAYETAFALKAEGKIRHVGISFHNKAAVLGQILSEYPDIEFVQIQFNYLDADDPAVEGAKCLGVCNRFCKPVIVMEPVKGGRLADLPADAAAVLDARSGGSHASYALRYAASFDGVQMILSGMSSLAQMRDNLSFMKDVKPLDAAEMEAVQWVRTAFLHKDLIPCTACRYCTAGCPAHIPIPGLFSCMNAKTVFCDPEADGSYRELSARGGKASDCVRCGRCEDVCPQHLPIRALLQKTAKAFEKRQG